MPTYLSFIFFIAPPSALPTTYFACETPLSDWIEVESPVDRSLHSQSSERGLLLKFDIRAISLAQKAEGPAYRSSSAAALKGRSRRMPSGPK